MRISVWLLCLFPVLCFAQAPVETFDVTGNVVDPSTGRGIPGAHVTLYRMNRPSGTDETLSMLKTDSGGEGAFRFRLEGVGQFIVTAEREGYVRPYGSPAAFGQAGPKAPETKLVVPLLPEATIAGRVVDAETREPVAGLSVNPSISFNRGAVWAVHPMVNINALTDKEGRFLLKGLGPGDYYLKVGQPLNEKIGPPKPVENFRSAVEMSYRPSWYPGVESYEQAATIKVPAGGGSVEGIEIATRKLRTPAIRGRLLGVPDLGDGAKVELTLEVYVRQPDVAVYLPVARSQLAPNAEFQIDHLAPGRYLLRANTLEKKTTDRYLASLLLELGEQNVEGTDLTLLKGASLAGRVTLRPEVSGQPALPTDNVQVLLMPRPPRNGTARMWGGGVGVLGPYKVRAQDGAFTAEGVLHDRYRLQLRGIPAGYTMSEVLYNGRPIVHDLFTVDPQALGQRLEIKLAQVTGAMVVTAVDPNHQPAPRASVLVLSEPIDQDGVENAMQRVLADDKGRGTLGGLLPGVYRAIAFKEATFHFDDPTLVERLRRAPEFRVSGGSMGIEIQIQ